ncbi:MAG: hypothetical protein AOA66_0350 [Candidatus Bathyarchaeota archaeon BA2]|nr:MAG: hypothetical protein AOA66_0350 [Candidatus Bathyarchaeota archaeon BA2]
MNEEAKKVLEEAEQYLKKEKIDHSLSSILGSNPSRALVNVAIQKILTSSWSGAEV